MRSLAAGGYTAAQVEAQLRAPACRYTARFEVLDADLRHAGDLQGVYGASVDFDADREIKGALDLELIPDETLTGDLFRMRIKPWFGVVMPDGGIAEHPQGVYVWTTPDRELAGVGDAETWKVTLPDQGWVLEMSGPGVQPHRIDSGDRYTASIRQALNRAGFDDLVGVVASDEVTEEMMSWGRRRNIVFGIRPNGRWDVQVDTTPETWRTILGDLTDAIGYDDTWFDHNGLPRVAPAVDFASADPDVTYATEADGILLTPVPVTHELDRIANRVFARSKARRGNHMNVGVADLNDLMPDHPLAERNIRAYIDIDIDVPAGQGAAALEAQARRTLYRRLAAMETVATPSLAWPVHGAYDYVGVRFDGDRQLDTEGRFRESAWDLTMVTEGEGVGVMNHRLQRIVGTGRL